MEADIINNYRQKAAAAATEASRYAKLANTYSLLRLGVFALMILAIYFAVVQDDMTVLVVAFVVLMGCFAWLISRQGHYDRLKQYYQDLETVNNNEIESMLDGSNIYNDGSNFINEKHYYTADLDIFGKSSLFQLVNRSATATGSAKLASWLSAPADKEAIMSRQQAIKEIAAKEDWKQDLQAKLLFAVKQDKNQLQQLFAYLRIPLNLTGEEWLSKYAMIAPYLLATFIVLGFFFPNAETGAGIIGLANLRIVFSKSTFIKKADLLAGKISSILSKYAVAFEKLENGNWRSSWCTEAASALKDNRTSAKIKELASLIDKLNYHLNLIVGIILNVFLLWDIRQIIAIENWKRANQESLETAFNVIADFEAMISIAGLHINYPEWSFPFIDDGHAYTLTATQIAHPLINKKFRVANDYTLEDDFKIDIITGSNMAGKSTFLRTIGINAVLALCGAPVCAINMRLSVISMVSYMRIKDSLNESTSTFKAELDRLQMLLTAVNGKDKVFFLVDEMLRGTNSVDKYLGSKAVIEQLIRKKGVGMVATHDLQIAELEKKYPTYIRNFYFDIQVKDNEMLFDYKIKNGECKTFNATMLLKQIGIDVDA